MRAGWQDDYETREALRRGRELSKLEGEQARLRADLERQRDAEKVAWAEGGEAGGPSCAEWAARLREAAGYGGAPASEAVGERDLGLADGAETARGPHIVFCMQRDIPSFGGEDGWLQRGGVGEDGWMSGWQERADAAREGLIVDDRVRAAVGRMVRAGLELQAAGREATADFERRVREETRSHAKVRRFAAKWREAELYGGPRRAAALRTAARARYEAEATLAVLEARG